MLERISRGRDAWRANRVAERALDVVLVISAAVELVLMESLRV